MIFDQLTTDNGLSDNMVNDIVQDDKGFMWIATENGLNRFDGAQFKKFFRGDKPNELPGNIITRLLRMRGNYIAVGTDRGLAILNTQTAEFKRVPMPSAKGMDLFANRIQFITANAAGEIIVCTLTGVFVFDGQLHLINKMESGYTVEDAKTKPIGFAAKSIPLNHDTVLNFTANGPAYYDRTSKTCYYLENSSDTFSRQLSKQPRLLKNIWLPNRKCRLNGAAS